MLSRGASLATFRTCVGARAVRAFSVALTLSGSLSAAAPDGTASREALAESGPHYPRYGAGLRVGASPGTGAGSAFLLSLNLAYSPLALFAVGLDYDIIRVDNGADPGYCTGCLTSGMSWRAFAEVRPLVEYPVFPFARVSAGLSMMDLTSQPQSISRIGPAFGAAGGVEGRLRPVYIRLLGFATAQLGSGTPVRGSNHLAGVAVEAGAVF
jgi:hypothetical protein